MGDPKQRMGHERCPGHLAPQHVAEARPCACTGRRKIHCRCHNQVSGQPLTGNKRQPTNAAGRTIKSGAPRTDQQTRDARRRSQPGTSARQRRCTTLDGSNVRKQTRTVLTARYRCSPAPGHQRQRRGLGAHEFRTLEKAAGRPGFNSQVPDRGR